jgi:hypothetical protein
VLTHQGESLEQRVEIDQGAFREFHPLARLQCRDLLVTRQIGEHRVAERGGVGSGSAADAAVHIAASQVALHALHIDHLGSVEHTERGCVGDIGHEGFEERPRVRL